MQSQDYTMNASNFPVKLSQFSRVVKDVCVWFDVVMMENNALLYWSILAAESIASIVLVRQ